MGVSRGGPSAPTPCAKRPRWEIAAQSKRAPARQAIRIRGTTIGNGPRPGKGGRHLSQLQAVEQQGVSRQTLAPKLGSEAEENRPALSLPDLQDRGPPGDAVGADDPDGQPPLIRAVPIAGRQPQQ